MKELAQHPEVEAEIEDQVLYYENVSLWSAGHFIEELHDSLLKIRTTPGACHFIHQTYRRCQLRRFPFSLIYREKTAEIYVIALMHDKRHPDYWKARITDDQD